MRTWPRATRRWATRSTSAPQGAGHHRDVVGVQGHVALLDAGGGQCAQGGKILRQADGGDGAGQPLGRVHAQQLQRQPSHRVGLGGAADQAHGHRQFQRAGQVAFIGDLPTRQPAVAAVARGIGMRAGFDGPGVVAGGQHHGADAVHDALVVGGRAVGVGLGEVAGQHDAVAHRLTVNVGRPPDAARARQAAVGQVGQDAQIGAAAGPCGDRRRQFFGHGVDGVGAHRVARVDNDVGDDHGPRTGVQHPDFEFAETPAQLHQHRVAAVADGADFFGVFQDAQARVGRVADAHQLHLGNHQRARHRGDEAAVWPFGRPAGWRAAGGLRVGRRTAAAAPVRRCARRP